MNRWLVMYHHNVGGGSWWGERVVKAEGHEEAAEKCRDLIETSAPVGKDGSRTLRVCVYGPIPEDRYEYKVSMEVKAALVSEEAKG